MHRWRSFSGLLRPPLNIYRSNADLDFQQPLKRRLSSIQRTVPRKSKGAAMSTSQSSKGKDKDWTMASNINKEGEFKRAESSFRRFVTADGAGDTLKAESGRYHLYVSLACPWAHRTLIMRELKGLQDAITVNVVHWHMKKEGWHFDPSDDDDATADKILGKSHIREVYFKDDPDYKGRFTVPVLYDKREKKIVNNESSEIIRMLNSEFNGFSGEKAAAAADYYPEELRKRIDEVNSWVYDDINNGVYKSGFATTQAAYEKAVKQLFASLDKVEEILSSNRYLAGGKLTEADIRLYTTLVRFDPVYVGHFKCNIKRIYDYPNIFNYLKELYQIPAFGSTTNFGHIKKHYYVSHTSINPTKVVPAGPEQDLTAKHDRRRFDKGT